MQAQHTDSQRDAWAETARAFAGVLKKSAPDVAAAVLKLMQSVQTEALGLGVAFMQEYQQAGAVYGPDWRGALKWYGERFAAAAAEQKAAEIHERHDRLRPPAQAPTTDTVMGGLALLAASGNHTAHTWLVRLRSAMSEREYNETLALMRDGVLTQAQPVAFETTHSRLLRREALDLRDRLAAFFAMEPTPAGEAE